MNKFPKEYVILPNDDNNFTEDELRWLENILTRMYIITKWNKSSAEVERSYYIKGEEVILNDFLRADYYEGVDNYTTNQFVTAYNRLYLENELARVTEKFGKKYTDFNFTPKKPHHEKSSRTNQLIVVSIKGRNIKTSLLYYLSVYELNSEYEIYDKVFEMDYEKKMDSDEVVKHSSPSYKEFMENKNKEYNDTVGEMKEYKIPESAITNAEKQIEAIIEYFDFERVRKVMEALNWTWYGSEEVPSVGRVVLSARKLLVENLEKLIKEFNERNSNKTYRTGTGGFLAEATYYPENQEIEMYLSFEVDSISGLELVDRVEVEND